MGKAINDLVPSLTDKQRAFVLEYLIDYNATAAAKRAGYSQASAHTRGAKLLEAPGVKKLIGLLQKQSQKEFEIERNQILYNLWAMATRDGRDLVDDNGILLDPAGIKRLPDQIGLAINSIKQKTVRRYTEDDGTMVEVMETTVTLTDKNASVEMAMKHKGLFEADHQQEKATINFDMLFVSQKHMIDSNPIEDRLAIEEAKTVEG